jgi:hypothetical protein
MKKQYLTIVLLVLTSAIYAQHSIHRGTVQLNTGVGLSSWGIPIYVGLDFGVSNDITLGGEVSFRSYHEDWANNSYNQSLIGISGNGNYYFNRILKIPANWDFYAGLNLGFYIWNSPNGYHGPHSSGLGLGVQAGGRYYFTPKFGINLELGGGNSFSGGKFGMTFNLK